MTLRCAIYIVIGEIDPTDRDVYKHQSVILVSAGAKGGVFSVYGYDDAPHSYAYITFVLDQLPNEKNWGNLIRFRISKRLKILWTRELVPKVEPLEIIVNAFNPSLVKSSLY